MHWTAIGPGRNIGCIDLQQGIAPDFEVQTTERTHCFHYDRGSRYVLFFTQGLDIR
jgi:hypothetical protein